MNNRIEEYRKPLGLSQHRLGKRIGISRVSINKIETGKVVPSLKVANDIANALSVCMYQILELVVMNVQTVSVADKVRPCLLT